VGACLLRAHPRADARSFPETENGEHAISFVSILMCFLKPTMKQYLGPSAYSPGGSKYVQKDYFVKKIISVLSDWSWEPHTRESTPGKGGWPK
jgi:hypothetical protein